MTDIAREIVAQANRDKLDAPMVRLIPHPSLMTTADVCRRAAFAQQMSETFSHPTNDKHGGRYKVTRIELEELP